MDRPTAGGGPGGRGHGRDHFGHDHEPHPKKRAEALAVPFLVHVRPAQRPLCPGHGGRTQPLRTARGPQPPPGLLRRNLQGPARALPTDRPAATTSTSAGAPATSSCPPRPSWSAATSTSTRPSPCTRPLTRRQPHAWRPASSGTTLRPTATGSTGLNAKSASWPGRASTAASRNRPGWRPRWTPGAATATATPTPSSSSGPPTMPRIQLHQLYPTT